MGVGTKEGEMHTSEVSPACVPRKYPISSDTILGCAIALHAISTLSVFTLRYNRVPIHMTCLYMQVTFNWIGMMMGPSDAFDCINLLLGIIESLLWYECLLVDRTSRQYLQGASIVHIVMMPLHR